MRAIFVAALWLGVNTPSGAEELMTAPRKERNFSVALISSALLEDPVPFSGVQVTWSGNAHLALDWSVETLGHFTLTVLGMKLYVASARVSPYVFFRGGVSFQTFDSRVPPWFLPGAGIEYLSPRAFSLFFEGSPGISLRGTADTRVYAVATIGLGYRFGIRTSPPLRPFKPAEPGGLDEPCGEVSSGIYVCAGGLVCREGRCVRSYSAPDP